jgi:hypothetical protein
MPKSALFLVVFLFFTTFNFAQNTVPDSLQIKIPETWLGTWKGTMKLHYANGKTQEVATELRIQKTSDPSRWKWMIVYEEGTARQERPYELIAQNTAKGKYVVDEKNDILLDAYFADNTLMSQFEVQGNLLMTIERLEGDTLYFENIMAKTGKPNKSGGSSVDIPEVKSYPVVVMQRAALKKL